MILFSSTVLYPPVATNDHLKSFDIVSVYGLDRADSVGHAACRFGAVGAHRAARRLAAGVLPEKPAPEDAGKYHRDHYI
jgi:hypothetical protein